MPTLLLLYRYQHTALQAAVEYGHEPIVRLLLEFGADVNRRHPFYPIHCAVFCGESIVRLLLEYHADVNALTG